MAPARTAHPWPPPSTGFEVLGRPCQRLRTGAGVMIFLVSHENIVPLGHRHGTVRRHTAGHRPAAAVARWFFRDTKKQVGIVKALSLKFKIIKKMIPAPQFDRVFAFLVVGASWFAMRYAADVLLGASSNAKSQMCIR